MKYLIIALITTLVIGLTSCDLGPESPRGFSLPKGNPENGKLVFMKYQCQSCHTLKGVKQPSDITNTENVSVKLGGKSNHVKTYADLLTSVINPSHKFAKGYPLSDIQSDGISKMPNFNDVMTVTELVDLVTFLQPHYELIPYRQTEYRPF